MKLKRLNMDNSWWLQLSQVRVLIDPWLEGEEVDGFRWFNTQWHRTPPIDYERVPDFDLVVITQKYPDHLHAQTLTRLQPRRVVAPASTKSRLRRLLPESELVCFGTDQATIQLGKLRIAWLSTQRKIDPIYDALLIDDGEESVLVATHGIRLDERHAPALDEAPPCKLLVSPFNHYRLPAFLGGVVTPGLAGLKHLVESIEPDWVVATHDEDKHARGLVPRLAQVQRFDDTELQDHPWLATRHLVMADYEEIEL